MNAIIATPKMMFSAKNVLVAEDPHVDQRRLGPALDGEEHHQQHDADGDAQPDGRVAPAPQRRLLEPEHRQAHPANDQRQAPVVHRRGAGLVGRLG
jgi:hypothetical protein